MLLSKSLSELYFGLNKHTIFFLLVIYFIHSSVSMSIPISQFITPPPPPPPPPLSALGVHTFVIYICVLFLPCKLIHLYHFSRFHIYVLIYNICFSLSDVCHSVWQSLDPPTSLQMTQFHSFYGWVIFHCIYVPHLLYPFVCWWAIKLFPCPGYCKWCFSEHCGTWLFLNYGFHRVYAQ